MGSFGVDIELRMDPKSLLNNYKQFIDASKKLTDDVAKGVEGANKKLEQLQKDFASSVITSGTRLGRQMENQIQAIERRAAALKKTDEQRFIDAQKGWNEALKDAPVLLDRVTKGLNALNEERKRLAAEANLKAWEDETREMERFAAATRKTKDELRSLQEQERIAAARAGGATPGQVGRMEDAARMRRENEARADAAEAAREREAQLRDYERRAATARMSPEQRRAASEYEAVGGFIEKGATPEEFARLTKALDDLRGAERAEAEARNAQNRQAIISDLEREEAAIGKTREQLRAMRDEERMQTLRAGGASPEELRHATQLIDNRRIAEENAAFKANAEAREEVVRSYERQAEVAQKTREEVQELDQAEELRNAKARGYTDDEIRRMETSMQTVRARREEAEATREQERQEERMASIHERAERAGKTRLQLLVKERDEELAAARARSADAKVIEQLTRDYQKMITVEQQNEQQQRHGGGSILSLLFRGGRDIIEGRPTYGIMDLGRAAINSMGGLGGGAGAEAGAAGAAGAALPGLASTPVLIGGMAAALAGVEYASYKAAEAVGNYAEKIHNLQLETGMTVREVQQFEFITKVTGQDINSLQGVMRGMTESIAATGDKGRKARETLQEMGVDVMALRNGLISLPDLLEQIGTALEREPNLWKRNEEAMDLLHRAGIKNIAMLEDYMRLRRETAGMKFMSQEDVNAFQKMHEDLAKLGHEWEMFKLNVEAWLAKRFEWTIHIVTEWTGGNGPKPTNYALFGNPKEDPYLQFQLKKNLDRLQGYTRSMEGQHPALEYSRRDATDVEMLETRASEARRAYVEAYEDRTKYTQQQVDDLQKTALSTAAEAKAARDAATARQTIAQALLAAAEEVKQKTEHPFELPAEAKMREFAEARAKETFLPKAERDKAIDAFNKIWGPERTRERTEQQNKFDREMLDAQRQVARDILHAQMGGVQDVQIRELGKVDFGREVTRADVQSDIETRYQQKLDLAFAGQGGLKEQLKDINDRKIAAEDLVGLEKKRQDIVLATGKYAVQAVAALIEKEKEEADADQRERDLERTHRIEMSKIQLADREESLKYEAQLAERRAQLRFKGDSPVAGIKASYEIAIHLAEDLYKNEEARIALEEVGWEAERDHALNLRNLDRERYKAQEEAQLKLAEMQQKQLDDLKGKIEPLYHTLFTDPKKFGAQLRSTVTQAALHPIESGLSDLTAKALYLPMYGRGGAGGIAGMFNKLTGIGPKLQDVHLPNGALLVHVDNVPPGSPGGGGGPGGNPPGWDIWNWFPGTRPAGATLSPAIVQSLVTGGGPASWSSFTGGGGGGGAGLGGGVSAPGSFFNRMGQTFAQSLWKSFGGQGAPSTAQAAPGTPIRATPSWSWFQGTAPGGLSFGGGGEGEANRMMEGADIGGAVPPAAGAFETPDIWEPQLQGQPDIGPEGGRAPSVSSTIRYAAKGGISPQTIGTLAKSGISAISSWFKSTPTAPMAPTQAVWGETPGQESINRAAQGPVPSQGMMAARAGAGTVGMMLAQHGLLGNDMGTWSGALQGAFGGAGVGFAMGGPLGAAIGAAAGLGIGLGEMIAGVESPRNKAKREATAMYHIQINNSTADAIVSIANQNYGGNINIAVRSPEVRRMLGLYAAGTGQARNFPAGGDPHGASLVESGGVLSQQATYQYGQAYTYSSNLPVYGNQSSINLGSPSMAPQGNLSLSLNIGGQDASRFMVGQVVTPEVVQNQYNAAMMNSAGRVQTALNYSQPGSMVA